MKSKKLRPYMVWHPVGIRCYPDPALIVFAFYRTQALSLAYKHWPEDDVKYIDLRVRSLNNEANYWFQFADPEKLQKGEPHIAIKTPPTCNECGCYLTAEGECPVCSSEECQ